MATPAINVISAKLRVNTLLVAGQPPKLTFFAEVDSQFGPLNLGPLTEQQFTAIAAMIQVPGQMSIARVSQGDFIIQKQA
jgi:hypothetical protein